MTLFAFLAVLVTALIAGVVYRDRLLPFLSRWREWRWLAILLVVSYLAYRAIPSIDPRSGIDGFGDLFAVLIQAIKGVLIVGMAYVCKRHFTSDLTEDQEDALRLNLSAKPDMTSTDPGLAADRAHATRYAATVILVADRLGWLFWCALWAWIIL